MGTIRTVMKMLLAAAACLAAVLPLKAGGWYRPGESVPESGETSLPLRREVVLEPTRFMVVPTSQVLDARQYVVSFHELSYGIDKNIQVSLCPWRNQRAGRVLLGVKFGLRDDMAFGAGFIDQSNMLGLYLTGSLLQQQRLTGYGLLDCQLGSDFTGEGGIGTEYLITDHVKLMGEVLVGTSGEDDRTARGDLDFNIALRYMWPANKPLKIDFGMNLINLIGNAEGQFDGFDGSESFQLIYLDVSYSSRMR